MANRCEHGSRVGQCLECADLEDAGWVRESDLPDDLQALAEDAAGKPLWLVPVFGYPDGEPGIVRWDAQQMMVSADKDGSRHPYRSCLWRGRPETATHVCGETREAAWRDAIAWAEE